MKRYLLLLLPLFTLCANADELQVFDGIVYILSPTGVAKVTNDDFNPYGGDIVIPETVTYKGIQYKVTSIDDKAFYTQYGSDYVTSITIPNSVTSIGESAFDGCMGLKSVNIPNSVTSISKNTFSRCRELTSIDIPNSVTEIGDGAFNGCWGLTSIDIPNSVPYLHATFYGCSGLTSIDIPNSVTEIGYGAFEGCYSLTSVNIPNSVISIDEDAFRECVSLTSVTIGSGVTSIYSKAFSNCPNLTDVYCLAENVPNTYTDTFEGSSIEQSTLHVPVQSIDAYKATSPWNKFKNIVGDATGISRIRNNSVQVQQENGYITVEGVEEGTVVSVYDIKGVQIGSAIVEGGKVSIPTNLQTSSIAIVKVKDKSIKVIK